MRIGFQGAPSGLVFTGLPGNTLSCKFSLTEESHDEQGFAGRQPLGAQGGRLGEEGRFATAALAVQHERLAGGSGDVGLHLLQVLLPAVEYLTGTGK